MDLRKLNSILAEIEVSLLRQKANAKNEGDDCDCDCDDEDCDCGDDGDDEDDDEDGMSEGASAPKGWKKVKKHHDNAKKGDYLIYNNKVGEIVRVGKAGQFGGSKVDIMVDGASQPVTTELGLDPRFGGFVVQA